MKTLNLPGPPEKIIDALELETLFAQGLDQRAVARKLDIAYPSLSRKITGSLSLMQARTRGKAQVGMGGKG